MKKNLWSNNLIDKQFKKIFYLQWYKNREKQQIFTNKSENHQMFGILFYKWLIHNDLFLSIHLSI